MLGVVLVDLELFDVEAWSTVSTSMYEEEDDEAEVDKAAAIAEVMMVVGAPEELEAKLVVPCEDKTGGVRLSGFASSLFTFRVYLEAAILGLAGSKRGKKRENTRLEKWAGNGKVSVQYMFNSLRLVVIGTSGTVKAVVLATLTIHLLLLPHAYYFLSCTLFIVQSQNQ